MPAALVHTSAPDAVTAACIPRVAVPELPLAQVKFTVWVADPEPKLKLGGLMLGVPRLPVPVTVTAALMSWVLMMLGVTGVLSICTKVCREVSDVQPFASVTATQ